MASTNLRPEVAEIGEFQRIGCGWSLDKESLPESSTEAIDFRVSSEHLAA
ncbi:MAG TPA: hypothetical protein VGO67_22845 [Verrucomicrobiae bacterium]